MSGTLEYLFSVESVPQQHSEMRDDAVLTAQEMCEFAGVPSLEAFGPHLRPGTILQVRCHRFKVSLGYEPSDWSNTDD